MHNSGLQSQQVLYVCDSVDSAGHVLIDPNSWAEDGATARDGHAPLRPIHQRETWADAFGSPAQKADFCHFSSDSPYHNIESGKAYPAILATTANTDDRVVPGHTFKYVAALQAADIGDEPHLARIETRAGHGAGKPTDKIIEETVDMWAFAAHWTGLESGMRLGSKHGRTSLVGVPVVESLYDERTS